MNRFENLIGKRKQAQIKFLDNEFQVIAPGDFVLCAITGGPIKLDQLKYWSAVRQEAYCSAEAAMAAEIKQRQGEKD